MAILLLSSPSRTSNGIESGLSAANSQAPFEFQREDFFAVNVINDGGGNAQLRLAIGFGDVTELFTVGLKLKMSEFSIPARDGIYTVVSSVFTSLQTYITCEETYVSDASGGVMIIIGRENYTVQLKILNPDNTPSTFTASLVYIPNADGYLFVDFGQILLGIMSAFDLQFFAYSISYAESYDGVVQEATNLDNPLDAVRGRRQIGKSLGANMWNWILKPLTGGFLGRIFTDFHEPKIWLNNKRTLDILFDSLLSDRVTSTHDIVITLTGLDINKQAIGGADASITIVPAVWFDVPQMYAIDVETTASSFYTTYDAQYLQVNVLDEIAGPDLVNPLICRIIDPCARNTIMLQWINDVGGVDQWAFGYNQQVNEDVTVGEVIEFPIVQDFSTVRKTKNRLVHQEVQRITMTAENLLENEVRALKYIKSSPSLQVELDDNFFSVVVIGTFATPWQTQHSLHQFSVTIEMPVEFDWFEQVPI